MRSFLNRLHIHAVRDLQSKYILFCGAVMVKQFLTATIAMAVLAPVASAEKLLPGGVQYNANLPSTGLRITRQQPMTAGTTMTAPLNNAPLVSGVAASDFSSKVIATGSVAQTAPKMPPYIWNQSIQGGYWDSSGATKDVVWANKLYLYGGKFADGTPVPKEPIRDFNAMGHAFRTGATPTQAFWTHF
jgi:hypothetical protein